MTNKAILCILASLYFTAPVWSVESVIQTTVRSYADLPAELKSRIPAGKARTAKEIPASPFGTHTTVISEGGNPDVIAQLPDLIANAGYKWVEDYASAGSIEGLTPASAPTRWGRQRARALSYAQALHERGVAMLIRIDPLPFKRLNESELSDEQLAGGVAVARAVVHDLKPWVRNWQIWNEPNIGNEKPFVSAAMYVKVAAAVATAIRAEQPDAIIHGPGSSMLQSLATTPLPWIDQALAAGLMQHIDVFSYHPYRQPYLRSNLPEHASEFRPWKRWGSYDAQIADLRTRLRNATGHDVPLSVTEDGLPTFINKNGKQEFPPIVAAKYELRRDLLDAWLGISPRVQFCFYREVRDQGDGSEASFSTLLNGELRPLYFAAQNLHGLLDSGHHPQAKTGAVWTMDGSSPNIYTQVWRKDLPGAEELLVAFWAQTESDVVPRHWRGNLHLQASGFEAPRLFDLMAMPMTGAATDIAGIANAKYNTRKSPDNLIATADGKGWLDIPGIAVTDYPQILQLVRFKP